LYFCNKIKREFKSAKCLNNEIRKNRNSEGYCEMSTHELKGNKRTYQVLCDLWWKKFLSRPIKIGWTWYAPFLLIW